MTKRKKRPTCGDFGGVGRMGPCKKSAGWGTDHKGDGRCVSHAGAPEDRFTDEKQKVLDLLADGRRAVTEVAEQVGVVWSTIWRWRQMDPAFDAAFNMVRKERRVMQLWLAEEALAHAVITRTAQAGEVYFFLGNAGKAPWRDVRQVQHTGKVEQHHTWDLGKLSDKELRDLRKLQEKAAMDDAARPRPRFAWAEEN